MDFAWWQIWEEESPSLIDRLDILLANVCAYIANAFRGKDSPVVTFKDCMIPFSRIEREAKSNAPVSVEKDVKFLKAKFRAATAFMPKREVKK